MNAEPRTGSLLVATPPLKDPNFERSVVLLCNHDPNGSIGLVLNQTMDASPDEVVDDLTDYDLPLFLGGPVQHNMVHILHQYSEKIDGGIEIGDGLNWGGDIDTILRLLSENEIDPAGIRFFMGYAGWGPGQLENEIEQEGWIVTHVPPHLIFELEPDEMWRQILRRMGGKYAIMANHPTDIRVN